MTGKEMAQPSMGSDWLLHDLPMLLQLNTANVLAIAWFLICIRGYFAYTAKKSQNSPSLTFVMHHYRREWIRMAISREHRIADTNIIANLERSVSFFASSTLLIIFGLVTVLGSSEKVAVLLSDIPFSDSRTQGYWEAKVLLLICVFVFAFFKFTWSLRQYGFLAVMIGAAHRESLEQTHSPIIESSASIASSAAENFNNGLRSYYFSLAILGWFINAWVFMTLATLIVPVLYRREFRSKTLMALLSGSDLAPTPSAHAGQTMAAKARMSVPASKGQWADVSR